MSRLPGRLGELVARDVMTADVITVVDSETIAAAVETLQAHHVSGAPVIDGSGKLVGILSLSDLVRASSGLDQSDEELPPVALAHGHDATTWDLYEKARPFKHESSAATVAEQMSRRITSVTQVAPLVEVARVMCSGHWHRVPVVDESGNLCGIISTMDVLAAMVNTVEETV
jgi:CBS domain-containing protein